MTTTPTTPKKKKDRPPQWKNGAGKRCVEGKNPCKKFPYCDPILHPYWVNVTGNGKRERGPASNYRQFLKGDEQLPKTQRDAEILAGRVLDALLSPGGLTPPPPKPANPNETTLATVITSYRRFRDAKLAKVLAQKKKVTKKISNQDKGERSKLKATLRAFGDLTVTEFQANADQLLENFVLSFVEREKLASSAYAVLATILKPAVLWGAGQNPPIITRNPFTKYGFPIVKNSNPRTERCEPDREYRLFEAMRGIPDSIVGGISRYASWQSVIHFCEGLIDLGPRKQELLQCNNEHVDWQRHIITLEDTKYAGEARLIPFNPDGRVARYLETRRFAGRHAPLYLRVEGDRLGEREIDATWTYANCTIEHLPFEMKHGTGGVPTAETMAGYKALRFVRHCLRHEAATWLAWVGMQEEDVDFLCGWERQWTQGRYRHDRLRQLMKELAIHAWPREQERAQPYQKAVAL